MVAPAIQPLTAVAHAQRHLLAGAEPRMADKFIFARRGLGDPLRAIQLETQIVKHRALGRKRHCDFDIACDSGVVGHHIRCAEIDAVRGIPKQPLLPVIEFDAHLKIAAVEREFLGELFFDRFDDFFAVFEAFNFFGHRF